MMRLTTFAGCLFAASAAPTAHHFKKHNPDEARSYDCPSGYELQGKSCVSREIHAQTQICPQTFREINGRCVKFTPLLKQCPTGYTSSGKQCIRRVNLPATPFCQDGYMLTGKSCEKLVPVPTYCPSGYTQDNSGCVQYSAKLSECPVDFVRSGKGCTKAHTFPKMPTCSNEYTLEENTCVKFVGTPSFCPTGYKQDKNGCAQYTGKLSRCPQGYSQSNKGQCQKIHTFPKAPTCSNEYTLENNACVKFDPLPAFCPTGFQQDKNGCSMYANRLSECPVGFTKRGNSCKKVISFPRAPVCTQEYTLENNQCVKHVAVPAFCPAGFQQDKNGCAQYSNKLSQCPVGYTQSHKGCKRTTTIPRIPECDAGFLLENNSCTKIIPQPSYTVCHTGVKQGDMCVTTQTVPKQYVCNKGLVLQGNFCLATETYDCSKTVFDTVCTTPAAPQYGKKGGMFRQLGAKSKKHTKHTTYNKAPQPICEQVPRLIQKTCTRNNQTPAQAVCPSGFQMIGKTCTSTLSVPAQLVQPQARTINQAPNMVCPAGGCTHTEKAPLEQFCTQGYSDAGDRCVKTAELVQPAPRRVTVAPNMVCTGGQSPSCTDTQEAPLNYFCPNTFTEAGDRCIKTAQLIQPAPQKVTVGANMICTGGQSPNCVDIEEAPLNYFCAQGYSDAGDRCIKTADLIQPAPRKVTVAATMVCTGGQGASCTDIEKAPLNYFCGNGFSENGDKCIKTAQLIQPAPRTVTAAAQYQCAHNFSLSGKQCLSTETAAYNEYCADGLELFENKCASFAQHIDICTVGRKNKAGCVVTKTVSPQVTIVRTCTKGQKGC